MEIIGVIVIGLLGILMIAGALYLLLWIMRVAMGDSKISNAQVGTSAPPTDSSGMNQGDFHSGPSGYSPNSAYPDTFYGSGGQADDAGGHNEGDFNR